MFSLVDVTAGYGTVTVLREVTLHVPNGAVVALLGPNGAGKTTLLRVASGLLAPRGGRIEIDGVDVSGLSPHELGRRGVCHIAEGRAVFRDLTVRENLELFSAWLGAPDGVERAIDAFPRLGQRLQQVAGTLSGGEQQMLAVARSYVTEPSVVLLDEVSMGLAPQVVDEIFAFLARLRSERRSLLIVEQFVSKALRLADYACLLCNGRLALAAEPDELADADLARAYLGGTVFSDGLEQQRK
ncbi:MAG: ABC transporter ATP-binding protein [Actinobacteria bacterium]|nr:ABC transporter ATP-binding protein [Actinomycetota bacterium]